MYHKPIKNLSIKDVPIKHEHPGSFGAIRKHDIHTGIDLYCDPGTLVYSITYGEVVSISQFTGEAVGCGWWNDTFEVTIKTLEGKFIVYGEIQPEPTLKLGQSVSTGDVLGHVIPVLKKDKGLPMTMLHLEYYNEMYDLNPVVWELDTKKPETLMNPLFLIFKTFDSPNTKPRPKSKTELFDERWQEHLETGHYGLAIDDDEVIEYLDKKFELLKKDYPNFTYAQIKTKFSFCTVYMQNVPKDIIHGIEERIDNILKKNSKH